MPADRPDRPLGAWSTTEAAELAGFTYRQLDHLVRRGHVTPSIERGVGSGNRSWWSAADVEHLERIRARLDYGMTIEGALRSDQPPPLVPASETEPAP